jgi:hypothetical protein
MRAQRVWTPFEPDFGAKRVHPALQLAANFRLPDFLLPDFRKQEIGQKVRDLTFVVRSELRHLWNFICEWFCLSFQI